MVTEIQRIHGYRVYMGTGIKGYLDKRIQSIHVCRDTGYTWIQGLHRYRDKMINGHRDTWLYTCLQGYRVYINKGFTWIQGMQGYRVNMDTEYTKIQSMHGYRVYLDTGFTWI